MDKNKIIKKKYKINLRDKLFIMGGWATSFQKKIKKNFNAIFFLMCFQ